MLLILPTKHHTVCHTISRDFNEGLVSLHGFATQINGIPVDWILKPSTFPLSPHDAYNPALLLCQYFRDH